MTNSERVYSAVFKEQYADGRVMYHSDSGTYDELLWYMRSELKLWGCAITPSDRLVSIKIVELCFKDGLGNVRRLTIE